MTFILIFRLKQLQIMFNALKSFYTLITIKQKNQGTKYTWIQNFKKLSFDTGRKCVWYGELYSEFRIELWNKYRKKIDMSNFFKFKISVFLITLKYFSYLLWVLLNSIYIKIQVTNIIVVFF